MPLCARNRAYSAAKRSTSSGSFGRQDPAPPAMSRPSAAALASHRVSRRPSRVRSATPRRSRIAAARRIRSSSPSGSTTCRRSVRARSISRYWNIIGVTTLASPTSMRATSASASTASANTCSAFSILIADSARQPAAHPASAGAPSRTCRIGQHDRHVLPDAVDQPGDGHRGRSPPVSTIAARSGKVADWCASISAGQHIRTVARGDHRDVLAQPLRARWAASSRPPGSPSTRGRASRSSPRTARPPQAVPQVGDGRRTQNAAPPAMAATGDRPVAASSAAGPRRSLGVDPVRDHRDRLGVRRDQFGAGQLDGGHRSPAPACARGRARRAPPASRGWPRSWR